MKISTKADVDAILFGIGVDSWNRFQTFRKISKKLSPPLYWYGLGCAYTSSDNLYQSRTLVRKCFASNLPNRDELMNEGELEFLASLPDLVMIHRAMTIHEIFGGLYGVSWTLSLPVAEFFKDIYSRNHDTNHMEKIIESMKVPKSKIIAYFSGRDEKEVIFLG